MTDQIISFNTAKSAILKGFLYVTHGARYVGNDWIDEKTDETYLTTQTMLQRWLREIHNIQVYVYSSTLHKAAGDTNFIYKDYVVVVNGNPINDARDEEFQTYEDVMEFGLFYALNLVP